MKSLIVLLEAIRGRAKDIHYTASGPDFYSTHLLMDRVADDLLDFVDEIKESYFMYNDIAVPLSKDICLEVADLLKNDSELIDLIKTAIYQIEEISRSDTLFAGDNDLLGRISSNLKTSYALLLRAKKI